MTDYIDYRVTLSPTQKETIKSAVKNKRSVTIQLSSGPDAVKLTRRQINKIKNARQNKTGVRITLSQTQFQKTGGIYIPIISDVIGLAGKIFGGRIDTARSVDVDKSWKTPRGATSKNNFASHRQKGGGLRLPSGSGLKLKGKGLRLPMGKGLYLPGTGPRMIPPPFW